MHRMHTLTAAALTLAATATWAGEGPLTVQFSQCTEFVGLAPIDALKARAALPARYSLISDAAGARLVVRAVDCAAVKVGHGPARKGRVAQVGLLIASPDGTATDPNTSINNYTLTYASDSPTLVEALRDSGVPAVLDETLAIEVNPPSGTGSDYYAAVAGGKGGGDAWFLQGTVNTPGFATQFLANWWRLNGAKEIKMATDIPAISFDFASQLRFSTSRLNSVGQLLGSHQAGFPLSFRGAFAAGTMVVTVAR